jgi:predicted nucleic acid-binding protein
MKVMVDTNVILDVLLARKGFVDYAAEVMGMIERSEVEGYLCATTITTMDYLLSRSMTKKQSRKALHSIMELFEIAAVNRSVIEGAFASKINDFEDAVLTQAGILAGVDLIISRNLKDFKKSALRVLDPVEFLALFQQ